MRRSFCAYAFGVVASLILVCPVKGMSASGAQLSVATEKAAQGQPTPRLPNGHPDLTGFYLVDADSNNKALLSQPKPPYKPDAMGKVASLNRDKAKLDPVVNCGPPGVPRAGAPTEIVQGPTFTVMLYDGKNGQYSRLIPTDGRPHRDDLDSSFYGDSIGHWEGDSLVVDTNGLTSDTWLGPNGWFHSEQTHVVERFTREGNVLHYEATVEDPTVFSKPWVLRSRTIMVNTEPDKFVYKPHVCNGVEQGSNITDERRLSAALISVLDGPNKGHSVELWADGLDENGVPLNQ